MQIKEPLTSGELLELVLRVETLMTQSHEVTLTRDEAAELCDACRNFLMIKLLTASRPSGK